MNNNESDEMTLIGNIKAVGGEAVQIGLGDASVTVDLEDIDRSGFTRDGKLTLMKGQKVKVTGELEDDFFNSFSMDAEHFSRVK